MITFNCESCGHKIKVSDKYAGKKGKCPKCKQPIAVPEEGEKSAQQSSIIKFRCPSCNQKIGVTPDYAGKRVRCSKCKNPLRVPQASGQTERLTVEEETNVLRVGQEQVTADEGIRNDLGSLDELRFAEANAFSVEGQTEPNGVDHESGAYAERETGSNRPKKKRLTIFIGAGCVLVLLLVVIAIWSVGSDPGGSEKEMGVELYDVQKFAEDYIVLLSEGKVDEARALLSSEVKIDVQPDEIERISEQIGKSEIIQLEPQMTHSEKNAEGDRIFLWYELGKEDHEQSVIISITAIDEDLRVDGIAAQEPLGDTVSIGQNSFEELSGIILAGKLEKFGPLIAKFFGTFLIVGSVLVILQIISMWILFNKAGQPGWAAIVPFYNMWVLAEVGDRPGWVGLLYCFSGAIPFVGPIGTLVLWAIISIGVARTFGRGIGFGIGLTIIPFVFYPILAFAND